MQAAVRRPSSPHPDPDQRVFLRGLRWSDFEVLLAVRGDRSGVRMTYLEGTVELMSPSNEHERIKKLLARLLEAWAEEAGVALNGYGSWTLKNPVRERGLEPDESYVVGPLRDAPDLALEVIWTSGGLDKLEVCRGLGVPEVWIWQDGALTVWRLDGERAVRAPSSVLLPGLDLDLLLSFLDHEDQTAAVRAYRKAIRG